MKQSKPFLIAFAHVSLAFVFSMASSAQAGSERDAVPGHRKVFRVADLREVTWEELATELASAKNIVLGEKHNTVAIQSAQAEIIERVVRERQTQGLQADFTMAWEFLNFGDQDSTRAAFARFVASEIDATQLLTITQGSSYNSTYIPILEKTKALGGTLLGVNLSRLQKAPVVHDGISAADPGVVPPGFEFGSDGYHARFVEAMGDHADPAQIENYYAAQCLTDDVMAYQLLGDEGRKSVRFLVTGSFHADYFDGAFSRIRSRAPHEKSVLVRLMDASDYLAGTRVVDLVRSAKYGEIADYVVFVNNLGRAVP